MSSPDDDGGHDGTFENPEATMSYTERFEALVFGSGAGGRLLAWHLARSGQRTAVVERQ